MSKYEPLWRYIKDNKKEEYKLTYEEIRSILGFDLDHSFLKYKKELLEYGYEVVRISIKDKYVLIHEIERGLQWKTWQIIFLLVEPLCQ